MAEVERMNGLFLTDRGQIRSHNEDAGGIFFNQSGDLLAVIADGMGGHQAGDVASQLATSLLQSKWQGAGTALGPEEVETWLRQSIKEINDEIYNYAEGREDCHGMGTTIVLAVCTESFISIAHIGDSRCYLYNEQGFNQITEDHSLVNELVKVGQITKAAADHHPRKNVLLKALGTEADVKADVRTIEWDEGDQLLLCSDGLSNKVPDEELGRQLAESENIEAAGSMLINLANERGGEDNISIAIVRHEAAAEKEAGENGC